MFLTASRQSAGDISRCAALKRKQLVAAIEVVLPDLLLALISGYGFLLFDYAKRFERHIDPCFWLGSAMKDNPVSM